MRETLGRRGVDDSTGPSDRWSNLPTPPKTLSRRLISYGLIFLGALVLGWIVSRPFVGSSAQPISDDEYTAVVAQLFQRDHDVALARQRLAAFGSPTTLAQTAVRDAANGQLKNPADAAALSALNQALAGAPSSTTSTTSPAGATTAPATAQPVAEQSSWLGPVLAFILAFALGTVVLLRTAGLSLPRFGVPRFSMPSMRLPDRGSLTLETAVLRTENPFARRPRRGVADVEPDDPPEPRTRQSDDVAIARAHLGARPLAARPPRTLSFESTYRLGDDPFDEIHPIRDPQSGHLIAACGLSAALKRGAGPNSRYYAFTAWIQDYGRGEQLRAVGLVSRGAPELERVSISDWLRGGEIADVVAVQRGTNTSIETDNLLAELGVPDVEFGELPNNGGSHFARLVVHFEIQLREHGSSS